MESLVPLLIQLATGAAGGNIFGTIFKKFSLGALGNTVAGVLGGGVGGSLLGTALGGALGGDLLGQVAGSAVGGGGLMVVVGLIKSLLNKN